MNQILVKYKDKIIDFLVLLFFSIFVYSVLITNGLVNNYDGIWEGNFHIAGDWELSIGRWFWYYLSKLRFGIAIDPVISIISLSIFVIGFLILADLMGAKERLLIYVAGAAFICTPLVCIDLSYRYMSPTFATAFLLSVLCVYISLKVKSIYVAIPVAGLVLSLSLGSYQAYLGVACVIVLAYLIRLLFSEESVKTCLLTILRPVVSIILGGILYIILLNIHLAKNHVEMAGYKGASNYSLLYMLKSFPKTFGGMYQVFHYSLNEAICRFNRLGKFYITYIMVAMFAALLIYFIVKLIKKDILKIVLIIASFLLLPVAAFAVRFITVDADVSIQMTAGFFLIIPALLFALPFSFEKPVREKVIVWVCAVMVMIFAYGGFYQVQTDQAAMYEGKQSTLTIANAFIQKTIDLDLCDSQYTYCIIGSPIGSQLYYVDEATYGANIYSVFGAWWADYFSEMSWDGVLHSYMGLNLNLVNEAQYNMIIQSEAAKDMPVFPQEGSVEVINDIVVIKVSE